MDPSTVNIWTGLFPIERASIYFSLLQCFLDISAFNANSVDSDLWSTMFGNVLFMGH